MKKARAEMEAAIRESVSLMPDEAGSLENKAGDVIRQLDRGAQILSLSSDPGSVPMWYHYADQYRGVVVAFDCQADPDTMFGVAQPVEYLNTVPEMCSVEEWVRVCTGQQPWPKDIWKRLYLAKSAQWAYEQEWRFPAGIGAPGSHRDLPLVAAELGGLVIGPKTDATQALRLTELAKTWNPSCNIWTASVNFSSFGLQLTEFKSR